MESIEEISRELRKVFEGLRDGTIDPRQAVEMNNTAGKIIGVAKVQLAYHAMRDEKPNIPFLAAEIKK